MQLEIHSTCCVDPQIHKTVDNRSHCMNCPNLSVFKATARDSLGLLSRNKVATEIDISALPLFNFPRVVPWAILMRS